MITETVKGRCCDQFTGFISVWVDGILPEEPSFNPLPHMPILTSSNSAANKDMMS